MKILSKTCNIVTEDLSIMGEIILMEVLVISNFSIKDLCELSQKYEINHKKNIFGQNIELIEV